MLTLGEAGMWPRWLRSGLPGLLGIWTPSEPASHTYDQQSYVAEATTQGKDSGDMVMPYVTQTHMCFVCLRDNNTA